MKTTNKKYAWGELSIRADFSQATDTIQYQIDGDGTWRNTPIQVADARHRATEAISRVNRWLKSQNPNHS